jgi:hypothetical protein
MLLVPLPSSLAVTTEERRRHRSVVQAEAQHPVVAASKDVND